MTSRRTITPAHCAECLFVFRFARLVLQLVCSSTNIFAGLKPWPKTPVVLQNAEPAMCYHVSAQDAAADLEAAYTSDPESAIGTAARRTARRLVAFVEVSNGILDA